ncbi:aspartokinase I/homoserine dehydrogenase I [Salmonella enterica subsp. arizonae]|uniref:Aspartokinase I/homoserine dehydrogenase I n=1 Tax=Salmonella enterica subsp. arizonae TaxID=59203 RepID=A0A379TJF3_SALER|nr:aspartokinase I/homoserine dehydrogenase I [Salmonella enterica subsp. arizonae]
MAIAQGSSERSISVVVNNDDATTGVRVTHQMLFNTDQVIEVFVIGVGGVGGALLEQLKRQQSWLKNKHIDLRVCGVANSKVLLTNVHGLNLENWQAELAQANAPFKPGALNSPGERISFAQSGDCRLYLQPGGGRPVCRLPARRIPCGDAEQESEHLIDGLLPSATFCCCEITAQILI